MTTAANTECETGPMESRTPDRATQLEAWQWAAVRRGVAVVILGLAGDHAIPAGLEPPQWPLALERFTIALELQWQVVLPPSLPEAVVARAAARRPAASELAGLTRSRVPTPEQVRALSECLERLRGDLKGEPELRGVADLAGAVARILQGYCNREQHR